MLHVFAELNTYVNLSPEQRVVIISALSNNYSGEKIVVRYNNVVELWYINPNYDMPELIESWDMNNPDLQKYVPLKIAGLSKHPWFFYIGGQLTTDFDNITNAALNTRLGFFMLKNHWDLALNGSYYIQDNSYVGNTMVVASLGVDSRVFYPIRELRMSPYVGIGIALNSTAAVLSEDNDAHLVTFTMPVVVGISWFVGPGSLDIGIQYNKALGMSSNIGYTVTIGALNR